MEAPRRRYDTLDAWRGIAALSVLVFHCGNTLATPETLAGRLLLAGWLGVFIFFPVSGYCILAALNSPENRTVAAFLARRWRRIVPPYWASIAVAILVGLAALPFNGGSVDDFVLPPATWATMLTLTQVFTDDVGRINPVYWSLCFEEQFYLVMALLLTIPRAWRTSALAFVTVVAALYVSPAWPWRLRGVFLEYWLCFAAGCGAYIWVQEREARAWGAGLMATAAAAGAGLGNTPMLASAATAVAIAGLSKHDATLATWRSVAPLMAVGTFSFSLYLIHVPIGGRITNLLHRLAVPAPAIVVVSSAVSLAAAWLFFVTIERRTLRGRQAPEVTKAPERAVAVLTGY